MKRTYIAYHGNTEFTFESEHRAGSAANLEDAQRAARRRFGKPAPGYVHKIDGVTLRKDCPEKPLHHVPDDLSFTAEEADTLRNAFISGKITFIGAKPYGQRDFISIKNAHGWTNGQFERAIVALRFNK